MRSARWKIIIFCFFALFFGCLLVEDWYKIHTENLETTDLITSQSEDSAKVATLSAARALKQENEEDLARFDKAVLSSQTLASVLGLLERAGAALGIAAKIANVDKVAAEDGHAAGVRVTADGDGSWRGSYLFLRAAESLPYRVTVENASLIKGEKDWHAHLVLFLPTFD